MLSFTEIETQFSDLSLNKSSDNLTRAGKLLNNEHRYLLQKYFNNEGSYSIPTVGATIITLTAAPAISAVSGTLSVAWPSPTATISTSFSDGEVRDVLFTNGSTAVTWQIPLNGTRFTLTGSLSAGVTTATLSSAWSTTTQSSTTAFSDGSTKTVTFTQNSSTITWAGGLSQAVSAFVNTSVMTSTISVGGQQYYRLPPNYSKLKDVTITIGSLKWTPKEVLTREEWDKLNVFPYYGDIPNNYFIYPGGDKGGMIGIWPIPSTSGNTITFNYKFRIPDLSLPDVTGTATVVKGATAVTGASGLIPTVNPQLESRWIRFAQPDGDNLWYQVASVDSTTALTLYQPYQGTSLTTKAFTMGQMPLLMEDFHDMLTYACLKIYWGTIKRDSDRFKMFEELYSQKQKQLDEYAGSKTTNVNLGRRPLMRNPNIFQQNIG